MKERISVWEGEGGSLNETSEKALTGTVNQIEWAKQIRTQVNAEFDRVITALEAAATKQSGQDRMDTQAIIAIVEEKRTEVMEHQEAGYFIHDWQELRDQVRQMIMKDNRYKTIKAGKGQLISMPERSTDLPASTSVRNVSHYWPHIGDWITGTTIVDILCRARLCT